MNRSCTLALFFIIGALAACATPRQSQPVPKADQVSRPANSEAAEMTSRFTSLMEAKLPILDRVASITARDWYVRQVFIPAFSDPDLDDEVRQQFQKSGGEYVTMIDTLNTAELKRVLEDYSWEEIIEGDPALFGRVFQVVQHSPDNIFKAAVLTDIKPFVDQGLVDKALYATMYDGVQLSIGKEQSYGTQYKCVGGQYDTYSLAEPSTVDSRRALMGMGPLQEYLEEGRKLYGPCKEE